LHRSFRSKASITRFFRFFPNFLFVVVLRDDKFNLDLDFPNLPYYIDGDIKLTQSRAILRYLGRINNLYGKDAKEASTIDMLIDAAHDMKTAILKIVFNNDYENIKIDYIKDVDPKVKQVSDFLGDKKFMMGDNVTIADFPFMDVINWNIKVEPGVINKYPNIVAYKDRFDNLPQMKSYFTGARYFTACFPSFAKIANK
jgi:glutathione S-transferase